MSDFLDKLNTLLRANINSLLDNLKGGQDSKSRLSPDRLGGDVDREIAALRKQIDKALSDEDSQQEQVNVLRQQIVDLDQQIDSALQSGDDAQARQITGQLRRQQQRLSMIEADLERHKQATFDLMQHVNTLEAMVSDARRAKAEESEVRSEPPSVTVQQKPAAPIARDIPTDQDVQSPQSTPSTEHPAPRITVRTPVEQTAEPVSTGKDPITTGELAANRADGALDKLSEILRNAREKAESAELPAPAKPDSPQGDVTIKTSTPVKETDIDADLAKRRARLSKPD